MKFRHDFFYQLMFWDVIVGVRGHDGRHGCGTGSGSRHGGGEAELGRASRSRRQFGGTSASVKGIPRGVLVFRKRKLKTIFEPVRVVKLSRWLLKRGRQSLSRRIRYQSNWPTTPKREGGKLKQNWLFGSRTKKFENPCINN